MSREIRKVPKDWVHPQNSYGNDAPLYENYEDALNDFNIDVEKMGMAEALDYHGGSPVVDDYMPTWSEEEKTHIMMYETCSEGTPISPGFETPEQLAHWLADNGASSFGNSTATYEQWLRVCMGGWAPSAIMDSKGLRSGVEALSDK